MTESKGLKHLFRHDKHDKLEKQTKVTGKDKEKDKDKEKEKGEHGLSKFFHHNSSGEISRTPSILSLRRHQTQLKRDPPKKLSKAETMAHLQHIKEKNKKNYERTPHSENNDDSSIQGSTISTTASYNGSINGNGNHEKIVYNPFGMNRDLIDDKPKEASFYMANHGDGRILSNPVHDPNDYLPHDLQEDHINLFDDFDIDTHDKKLGDGGSSDVRLITLHSNKKKVFALKRFTLLDKETDSEFYKRATKEFIISKKASAGRHIVNTLTIVRIQSLNDLNRGWGFVMEFCPGGDLFNLIIKPGWKRSSLSERYCIFKQITYGVKFLHDQDIVHRDLKPENIIIDQNGLAKLCDFGVSDYGHTIEGDLTSEIKTSTAFVGSPPYSPPEVMKLKEVSHNELKNWAYDPFKMDYWGLGMLLFVIVYGGVPFNAAHTNDHGFRDYKFTHHRFCSDNANFKNNIDYNKGPGSEFKWAAQFQNHGAARVAWKLCDPSVKYRYDMNLLLNDPWFQSLEMCVYEDQDQSVSGVIFPCGGIGGTGSLSHSNSTSNAGSRAPSRSSSKQARHVDEVHHVFKSMLDLGNPKEIKEQEAKDHKEQHVKDDKTVANTGIRVNEDHLSPDVEESVDQESIKSASSLTALALNCCECHEDKKAFRSMLDFQGDLPIVKEHDNESKYSNNSKPDKAGCECDCHKSKDLLDRKNSILKLNHNNGGPDSNISTGINNNGNRNLKDSRTSSSLYLDDDFKLTDVNLDSQGICDLGYKIKKHHHLEISGVAISGSGKWHR